MEHKLCQAGDLAQLGQVVSVRIKCVGWLRSPVMEDRDLSTWSCRSWARVEAGATPDSATVRTQPSYHPQQRN